MLVNSPKCFIMQNVDSLINFHHIINILVKQIKLTPYFFVLFIANPSCCPLTTTVQNYKTKATKR